MPRSLEGSSIISSKVAATPPAAAMFVSPRSIPSSTMSPFMRPSTAPWPAVFLPCRANVIFAVQTGMRASELLGLRCEDITLAPAAFVRCQGKGRKLRSTPLRKDTIAVLRCWLAERQGQPSDPAFPTINGSALSHDAFQYLIDKHVAVASQDSPSLAEKRVTPHVLRHTLAMDLLHHGIDRSVIALWLGHESVETTVITCRPT